MKQSDVLINLSQNRDLKKIKVGSRTIYYSLETTSSYSGIPAYVYVQGYDAGSPGRFFLGFRRVLSLTNSRLRANVENKLRARLRDTPYANAEIKYM